MTDAKLKELGFGYRAPYIVKAVELLQELGGEDYLLSLRKADLATCRKGLTSLMGVGNKVADCISMFSLYKANCVPVDTHVF